LNTWLTLPEAREYLHRGRGKGIKVAVLDSGIETETASLRGLSVTEDWGVRDDGSQLKIVPGEGRDLYGHGTAIAGIIHELAPEAEIGSFRVLGEQLRSRTAIICEGVRQALARGFHILNCSFGCSREDQVLLYKEWIDEAYLQGRHIVAASNNLDSTRREWPGHFATVVTVSFVRSEDPETLLYRSRRLVEFAARGQDIEVAWPSSCAGGTVGLKKVTGSSFAAPHVTGLLARLLSGCPTISPLQAKALLQQLAMPWV
jgi:subtilisin family serine protease